jgi:hypothetical protein
LPSFCPVFGQGEKVLGVVALGGYSEHRTAAFKKYFYFLGGWGKYDICKAISIVDARAVDGGRLCSGMGG